MTRVRAIAAFVILLLGVGLLYAQEQVRYYNMLVLDRLELGAAVDLIFEGATANGFETTVTVTDPTADRTITLPNDTGTVVLATGASTAAMVSGSITLDGSNPSSATTGLTTIDTCVVTANGALTPGDDPVYFTTATTASAGRLDVYAWLNNGSDPTLSASSNATAVVPYICVGTP